MAVRPWCPEDLARVCGSQQATFDRAVRRLGFPGRSEVTSLAALGETTMTVGAVGAPAPPGPGDTVWALRRHRPQHEAEASRGFVLVDALACLGLVSATLGLPAPKVHRPPTPIEGGIVAAALGALLRRADPSVTIDLEPVVDWPTSTSTSTSASTSTEERWTTELVELEVTLTCASFRESARLQIPPAWIPNCPATARGARLAAERIPVRLPVELARTFLGLGDWSAAEVGDAVVFDGVPAVREGYGWRVSVHCGLHAAAGRWEPTGIVRLDSDFQPFDGGRGPIAHATVYSSSAATLDASPPAPLRLFAERRTPAMADDEKLARLSMLAAAPLEVVAEVGEVILRADELIALQRGSVISLKRPRTTLVELKIAERVWARGELVDVDGELGVRVTELTAAPEPSSPSSSPSSSPFCAPTASTSGSSDPSERG